MRKKLHEQTPKLLPRDLQILEEIWRDGFCTYEELNESFLKNYSKSWGYRILKRLALLGYIDDYYDPRGRLLGWKKARIGNLPDELLHIKNSSDGNKMPKYFSTFDHDKSLREVLNQFRKLPLTLEVTPESELRREALSNLKGYSKRDLAEISAKVPDGRLKLKLGQNTYVVALEVELSQKSNERIQSKLEHYIAKSNYDFVLYVCGKESVFNKLFRNYRDVYANSPKIKFSEKRNPIYFCALHRCKLDLLNTKISSIHDSFTLSQFMKLPEKTRRHVVTSA
jgi:hypothetical protein